MAEIKKMSGETHYISFKVIKAVVEKVEKWNEISFSTTTTGSGGGGFICQGYGYIDPASFSTTTSSVTQRHTRIYFTADGWAGEITAYGMDLPVVEGSFLDISWYVCSDFRDKIAGFLDRRDNTWYMLNTPEQYLSEWLGISRINLKNTLLYSAILLMIVLVSYRFNKQAGEALAVALGVVWIFKFGIELLPVMLAFPRYSHKDDMERAGIDLRNEFLRSLGVT